LRSRICFFFILWATRQGETYTRIQFNPQFGIQYPSNNLDHQIVISFTPSSILDDIAAPHPDMVFEFLHCLPGL